MNNKYKKSLFILAVASLLCSRLIFAFIKDPEGPNLLIVAVLGVVIFALFLAAYYLSGMITKLVLNKRK